MGFNEFMNKVRKWDNHYSSLIVRHFYIIFFEFILVIIFFIWFFRMISSIDLTFQAESQGITEQLLVHQVTNTQIIVVLLLLNSFWMLYMFSSLNRMRYLLKDISFNLMRRRKEGGSQKYS